MKWAPGSTQPLEDSPPESLWVVLLMGGWGGLAAQLPRGHNSPLELLPLLPLFIAVYSDLSVVGDENTHPEISASGTSKKSSFVDFHFAVHFSYFFVEKKKREK